MRRLALLLLRVYATAGCEAKLSFCRTSPRAAALVRREWAEEHADAFASLDLAAYPPSGLWSAAQFTEELSSGRSSSVSAWTGHRLVAFVCAQRVLDETSILSLVVHPSWRRAGLARTLVLGELCSASAAGQTALTLEGRESNDAAIRLYERCGFRTVGRRPRYYKQPPPAEDAVLLTASLADPDVAAQIDELVGAQPKAARDVIRRAALEAAQEVAEETLVPPQLQLQADESSRPALVSLGDVSLARGIRCGDDENAHVRACIDERG